jgi:hypothetical protein
MDLIVDFGIESRLRATLRRENYSSQPNWSFVMKKIVSALAVVALMAPSVASAATAAGALSVKSAAVQPVRAAAKPGKAKAASGTLIAVLAAAAVVGGIVIASDGSDSK